MKTQCHIGLSVLVALLVLALPARAVMLFEGQFQVVSADPWELELRDASGEPMTAFSAETGLPRVRAEYFRSTGRDILPADVGKTYTCWGSFPDMGGAVHFHNDAEGLSFSSTWQQPGSLTSEIRSAILKKGAIALCGLVLIASCIVMVVRRVRR